MGLTNEQAQKLEHDLDTNHTEMIVLTLQDANRLAAGISSPHEGSTQTHWLCPRTDKELLDGGWGCTKSLYQSTAHQWVNTNWVVPTGMAAHDTFKETLIYSKTQLLPPDKSRPPERCRDEKSNKSASP
ncbi:hypothetical protein NLO85_18785 [Pseudomonas savastanoi]|uniref:Uncharacterized protein n=1 Tax=Pseudomonas savastanoi TaxID=29438 RepID=A0AAW5JC74_PSESS|nr:hypothetical protein [Pseudomonas savastanoi]MCQ3022576.1 hypothetical protein [Pseudomonas savastanoi]